MKLVDAVELAVECGLETYREALLNVDRHAMILFVYSDIKTELDELEAEFILSGKDEDDYLRE